MISDIFSADYYDHFIPKLTPNFHVSLHTCYIHWSEHERRCYTHFVVKFGVHFIPKLPPFGQQGRN